MASVLKVKGLQKVVENLRKMQIYTPRAVERGLVAGGLFIQRESQLRVPVDTGNLKASAFTRVVPNAGSMYPGVIVGFTAGYALYVHEAVGMKLKGQPRPKNLGGSSRGKFWDPQGRAQAKFLESVVREKKSEIVEIVKTTAKRMMA